MDPTWNPWHGCKKYSEGCENCYMYYLDARYEKDGSQIYKVKSSFNLPLKKTRDGQYKVKSGEQLLVCMTSDFFIEEADEWRDDIWQMIRLRPDVTFWLQTKRIHNVKERLPWDWGEGWKNVRFCVTAENQKRVEERIPILLELPFQYKAVMCAPILSAIDLKPYLKTGQIKHVLADGENYEGTRPCHYEWIKSLYEQCKQHEVRFQWIGTGNVFVKENKTYHICKAYQQIQAKLSGLQYPPEDTSHLRIQKRCATCARRNSCNGCKNCGKC